MTDEHSVLTRRTLIRGAAWSVPVIVTAAAVPLAAASPVPGNSGNYYWADAGGADPTTLTFSTWSGQIATTVPVVGAMLFAQVTFNQDVTVGAVTGRTFSASAPTGPFGHNLTFAYTYSDALVGTTLTSDAVMSIVPADATTWSSQVQHDEIVLPPH